MKYLLALCLLVAPQMGFACGGLFCNAQTPVNQAAERILFAQGENGLEMHVRLTYQGPPTEFGWLLPVPRDIEYGLSADQVFTALDNNFAPSFRLRTEIDPDCEPLFAGNRSSGEFSEGESADAGVMDDSEPSVAVLSREAVGPYDLALLLPETVDDLRRWLDDNGYQIPDAADATLSPYVDMGSAFIALKLLPTAGSGDVTPIRMSFNGDIPAIPIVPTSVAADPDMGIIVHLLGDARGVSTNYRHVTINEATIDWASGGQNYADVVSQAVDEAGGQAFVTDFAGAHDERIFLRTVEEATLEFLRGQGDGEDIVEVWLDIERRLRSELGRNDSDLRRVLQSVIVTPETIDVTEFLRRPGAFSDHPDVAQINIDFAAMTEKIEAEINEPRIMINDAFTRNPYLTRLYSTMSAHEMTLDPMFGWNRDLPAQSNIRNAVRRIRCVMGTPDWDNATIETESGIVFREEDGSNPNVVLRQEGETIRGQEDLPAAQVITEQRPAGMSRVIMDNTAQIRARVEPTSGSGCACDASGTGTGGLIWLGLLLLPALLRRRS